MVESSLLKILGVDFSSGSETIINAANLNLMSAAPGRHNTSGIPAGNCTTQPLLSALSFGECKYTQGMEIHTGREKDQERCGPTKEELLQNWRNSRSRVKHRFMRQKVGLARTVRELRSDKATGNSKSNRCSGQHMK